MRILSEKTDLSHGKEGLLRQLQSAARRVMSAAKIPSGKLVGIGIADPGLVDTRRGVTTTCSTIDFWNDVPVTATFEKEFKVPILVESKTRARAVAEQRLGVGERESNMVYLDYGTGIGAGVIVDGKLLYGANCGAGEVGHTNMVRSGPTCKCGSNGCLEAVAGASAVENRTRKALAEGVSSQLLSMAQEDPARITVWLVLEAARQGDKMCWNIVAEVAEEIGIAMANLVNLFNPAMIVFDHRLAATGEEFLNLVARVVKSNALAGSASKLALRFAGLGRDAGLLGVGLQVLERHYGQG
jgi:predicted NBD/HSP70 family sugar kinase